MNVGGVLGSLQQGIAGTSRSLVFRSDGDFNATLTLGQIIKGKVLRHYEGNRYGVSFGGQEKVVDSAVLLRLGEMIQGRVISIDEKVHLQRIADSSAEKPSTPVRADAGLPNPLLAGNRDAVADLFARFQASLTTAERSALSQLQARLKGSDLVPVSALILKKLALPVEKPLVEAIHQVLQQIEAGTNRSNAMVGPQLLAPVEAGQVDLSLVQGLAPMLVMLAEQTVADESKPAVKPDGEPSSLLSLVPEDTPRHEQGQGHQQQLWMLGQRLLNTQTEGSVAHRVLRFPLWFGERLVEVNLAVFSETAREHSAVPGDDSLRYRKAVFTLDTDNLGHVEMEARVANRHVCLDVITERTESAEILGGYLTTLTSALTDHGWQVDDIRYQTGDSLSGVTQAVVEHHVLHDSLSRLM
ncbi:MAG: flagellar hook-length control protein FliK [Pseudomonadales bacterium]